MAQTAMESRGGGGGGGGGFADTVGNWIVGVFSGEYPKPLPRPLPFTGAQVARMFQAHPDIARRVRTKVEGTGHVHLLLGHDPTPAELADPASLGRIALWLANGTGDDLSRGEDEIRNLIIDGMQRSVIESSPGGYVPGGTTTGGPTVTNTGGPAPTENQSSVVGGGGGVDWSSIFNTNPPAANNAGTLSVGFGPLEIAVVGVLVILAVKLL